MTHLIELLKYTIEILAILGVTVEFLPIKVHPLRWLGNAINKDIKEEIRELKKEIEQVKREGDYRDIGAIRSRIASFGMLVRKDVNLDTLEKAQYIACFKDIDKWNKYHIKYTELNGELKTIIEFIHESYKKAKFRD